MKYKLNIIMAHNGVEVISLTPTEYIHTIYDDIIADWRRQRAIEIKKQREEELSLKGKFKKIKKMIRRFGCVR